MKRQIYSFLIRWHEAGDNPLPAWLDRACQRDTVLKRELGEGRELTEALRRGSEVEKAEEEPSLSARVLRHVAEEDFDRVRETRKPRLWALALPTAIAAVAVVTVMVFQLPVQQVETPLAEKSGQTAPAAPLASEPEPLVQVLGNWENPLDQEMEYLVSDAKRALGFLADTFAPRGEAAEEDSA